VRVPLALAAAQLAAREQLREQRLSQTLLVRPLAGFRLAPVSQAYFPLVAEWRVLVSSQPPVVNFVIQAQPVARALGRPHLSPEQRLAREVLLELPGLLPPVRPVESPPVPAGLKASPFPPAFGPMPYGRRLESECRSRGRE
jgi:hypothetical protein